MSDSAKDADSTVDPKDVAAPSKPTPKDQMRAALDAKKAAVHAKAAHAEGGGTGQVGGGPHGQQGGKRTFRRKSGG